MSELGENIKTLCKERNLTFVEVERACELGNGTIRKWVNGTTPNIKSLSAVADYFHVSVDWLLGKTENRTIFEEWNKKYDVEKLKSEAKIYDRLGKIKGIFLNIDVSEITDYEIELLQLYMESLVKVRKQVMDDNTK